MCSSASECSACLSGYSLKGSRCIENLKYPCAVLNGATSLCEKCFSGYKAANGTCNVDVSCNTNSSCANCPYGFYLNKATKTCLKCQLSSSCVTCDSTPDKCVLCAKGSYLEDSTCKPCNANCLDCTSATYCEEAANGYFLGLNLDGTSNGRSQRCASPCMTCNFSPSYCLSCEDGYVISGSICQAKKLATGSLVMGSGSG